MTLTKHRQIGWVFFGKVKEDWRFDINTGIKKNHKTTFWLIISKGIFSLKEKTLYNNQILIVPVYSYFIRLDIQSKNLKW